MTERRSETAEGVEVLVSGDASRDALAQRALARGTALTERALGFLRGWLHAGFAPERGSFELVTLEVPEAVGVPLIRPLVVLTESPAGRPVALKLVGLFEAVIW